MPERAIELLEAQIVEMSELRNAHARDPRFKQWRQATLTVVQRIWPGDVARAERFRRVPFSPPSTRMSAKATRSFYEKGCAEALHLLREMMTEVEGSAASAPPPVRAPQSPGRPPAHEPSPLSEPAAKRAADPPLVVRATPPPAAPAPPRDERP